MILIFYLLAAISLVFGTATIFLTLIPLFPVQSLYYNYFIRKPITWVIFVGSLIWSFSITLQTGVYPVRTLVPLALMGLAVILTHKMHQENMFKAVDFPEMAEDIFTLPLRDDMQLGVIEYGGVTKAYPLDYVIHHHIINDRFGDRTVSLTFCAMCHSVLPFDVSDIGTLFVASYKNANMIMADRKTKTFFQQASFESIIGKLHPHTLTMVPFQVLSWVEIKKLSPAPQVVKTTEHDLREFQFPVPGVWKKIITSEAIPGLSTKNRDKSFPARTRVIGIIDPIAKPQVVYLKEELMKKGLTKNEALDIFFISINETVLCFKNSLNDQPLNIKLDSNTTLSDISSKTTWNIRGKQLRGEITSDLVPITISDEYWFSWKLFHPGSILIRVEM